MRSSPYSVMKQGPPGAPASHRPHLDHVELGHLVLVQAHGQQNVVLLDEHPDGSRPAARRLSPPSAAHRAAVSAGRRRAAPRPARRPRSSGRETPRPGRHGGGRGEPSAAGGREPQQG